MTESLRDLAPAARLRMAAAGRREYAESLSENAPNPALREMRSALLVQAGTLDAAARVVEGDLSPMFGWLPSWRWTPDMDDELRDEPCPRES